MSSPKTAEDLHKRLEDSPLSEALATGLRHTLCWSAGHGWLEFTGKVWESVADEHAQEIVRQVLRDYYLTIVNDPTNGEHQAKMAATLLGKAKVQTVTLLLKGILEKNANEFDQHPDKLNTQNCVVDLRTGQRYLHGSDYLFTKIAAVDYVPDATHPDWDAALLAISDPEVEGWLQMRFGQAASGHTTKAALPILQGNGANGKTTITSAVLAALGGHAVVVPEKVLLANPGDHPTELMTLQGARLAIIEELPEGNRLNVKRLKDIQGADTITARRMRQDFVTWSATHSLVLTTNYKPRVTETDHGTWRRLAMVTFPYTFRAPGDALMSPQDRVGDPGLQDRLRNNSDAYNDTALYSQLEAVLAWVVEGARYWYDSGQEFLPTPAQVVLDTEEWRGNTDLILGYFQERLQVDSAGEVIAKDLYDDFSAWLFANGHANWTEGLFNDRFKAHDLSQNLVKARTRSLAGVSRPNRGYTSLVPPAPITGQAMVWRGITFSS